MKRRIIFVELVLVMSMLCSFVTCVHGAEIVASGSYKDTLSNTIYWSLNDEGILTISGTGKMTSYTPWEDYDDDIKFIEIESGITRIGYGAFSGTDATGVTIPDTVTYIEAEAFVGCRQLKKVIIPDSVTKISSRAFYNCTSLIEITLGCGVTSIGDRAFYGCSSLTFIAFPKSIQSIGYDALYTGSLENIYYEGSTDEWNSIDIEVPNKDITYANKYYNIDPDTNPSILNAENLASEDTKIIVYVDEVYRIENIMIALYNNGTLDAIYTSELIPGNESSEIPISTTTVTDAKIFIWDNFENMVPLCEPYSLPMQ